jgi:transcriptional regulator with XRE-family HTH domain
MLRPDHLGLAFRFLRTSRHLKQQDVAERAGITPSMLSGYENGRKQPTLVSLEKILEAMDCTLRDLVTALELIRDGRLEFEAQNSSSGSGTAELPGTGPRQEVPWPRRSSVDLPLDLRAVFGPEPLALEEEAAFGEMLSGYCRWLRYLRQQGSWKDGSEPS